MKATILVIEDDPITANLMELILTRENYEPLLASDGLEGLEMALSREVDLILLDLMLPRMDGLEVLNRLRADPRTKDLPVVVLSVRCNRSDRESAAEIGADAYLSKPYDLDEMLKTVRSLLR
jgi:DNA-binding response OmpR family regulator